MGERESQNGLFIRPDFKKMVLKNGKELLLTGNLKECDRAIIGILFVTKALIDKKGEKP